MPENPPLNMQPILDALRPELARGVRNIYIWDSNHGTMGPREVAFSPELLALMRQYGEPYYAVELAGTQQEFGQIYRELNALSPEALRAMVADPTRNPIGRGLGMMHQRFTEGGRIILPDPRGQAMADVNFTPQEAALIQRLYQNLGGSGGDVEQRLQQFQASLNSEDRRIMDALMPRFLRAAGVQDGFDTSAIDAEIVANTERARSESLAHLPAGTQPVTLTIYGAAHFLKPNDIDEGQPGVSVMVSETPRELAGVLMAVGYGPHRRPDLPDFIFYRRENRLVRGDTQQFREELGAAMVQIITERPDHHGAMSALPDASSPAPGQAPMPQAAPGMPLTDAERAAVPQPGEPLGPAMGDGVAPVVPLTPEGRVLLDAITGPPPGPGPIPGSVPAPGRTPPPAPAPTGAEPRVRVPG